METTLPEPLSPPNPENTERYPLPPMPVGENSSGGGREPEKK